MALVRYEEGPRFIALLIRAQTEPNPYLRVRYSLELVWTVEYALMPTFYGQSFPHVIKEANRVVASHRHNAVLPDVRHRIP